MSHRSQLLRRLLLAMGLGALPVGVLSSCVTERPSDPGSSDDDDGAPPGPLDVDNDGDGHTENEGDCDDGNAQIHPEAEELCDDVDNNCDGVIDEGVDEDGDTYRNCDIPDLIDCDDDNAAIHPGAIELCDGLDNDCDGLTDEDASDASTWYADSDSDGYGDANDSQQACDPPPGYVADNSDCDDADADTSPGDPEVPGDQQDNNCSGFIDEVDCPDAVVPTSEADILHGPNTFHMFCDGLPASGICPTPDFNVTSSLIIATVGAPSEPFCDWFTISTCGPDDTEATLRRTLPGVQVRCGDPQWRMRPLDRPGDNLSRRQIKILPLEAGKLLVLEHLQHRSN